MKTRLLNFWDTVLDSFWFLPTLLTGLSVVLFLITRALDNQLHLNTLGGFWWMFGGGPDGARTLLSTIAGSVITVAGTVFSITIAALTLASTQFGPRLLRNFTHDTGNQLTLGVFVGTFLYCLLVLRMVRSVEEQAFVPHISITVGLALGIASLLVLIYFIHHISTSIQATEIVASVGTDLCASSKLIFPQHLGVERSRPDQPPHGHAGSNAGGDDIPEDFERVAQTVQAHGTGYLQAIDPDSLLHTAIQHNLIIRLLHRPGDFVVQGHDVLLVYPGERVDVRLATQLNSALIIGTKRTRTQDIEFLINQLVEMAVRALSPAINDPFTAIACLDWLGAGLCRIARRGIPSRFRYDDQDCVRVIADPVTFAGITDAAFHLIRQSGSSNATILIHMLETITSIAEHTRRDAEGDEQRASLLRHAMMIERAGQNFLAEEYDRKDLEERYEAALGMLGSTTQ